MKYAIISLAAIGGAYGGGWAALYGWHKLTGDEPNSAAAGTGIIVGAITGATLAWKMTSEK